VEAAWLGFKEIQFDYVRFPDGRRPLPPDVPNPMKLSKTEAITGFLERAKAALSSYGAFVSADVFGFTTTVRGDMSIGQDFVEIAKVVDYMCPMLYPSHYYHRGVYGLEDPESQPYEVVFRATSDGLLRLKEKTHAIARLRPYLQDFSLRVHYGPLEVAAQIRAALDAGAEEYLLWNPASRYTSGVDYLPAEHIFP